MSSTIQNILIVLGLVVVALLGGFLYLQQSGQSLSLPSFGSGEPTFVDVDSQEFLARLEQLESIELDAERVFAHPHFDALVDFARPMSSGSVGRANPFEPAN